MAIFDELKCRIVFRGDLYDPVDPQDPWNPHASFLLLKTFMAICVRFGLFSMQVDFILSVSTSEHARACFHPFPRRVEEVCTRTFTQVAWTTSKTTQGIVRVQLLRKVSISGSGRFLESEGFEPTGLPGLG